MKISCCIVGTSEEATDIEESFVQHSCREKFGTGHIGKRHMPEFSSESYLVSLICTLHLHLYPWLKFITKYTRQRHWPLPVFIWNEFPIFLVHWVVLYLMKHCLEGWWLVSQAKGILACLPFLICNIHKLYSMPTSN